MPDEPEPQLNPWAAATFDALRRHAERRAAEQQSFTEVLQQALEARRQGANSDAEEGHDR